MQVYKCYSFVFYDAIMLTHGGIRNYPRLALISNKPMVHSVKPFDPDKDGTEDRVLDKMYAAAGMRYWHTLDGDAFLAAVSAPDDKGVSTVEVMQGPITVASSHEDFYSGEDFIPTESVLNQLFPEERFREGMETVEKTHVEMITAAIDKLETMIVTNAKFGFETDDDTVQRHRAMLAMAKIMAPGADRADKAEQADPESKAILDTLRAGKQVPPGTPMPLGLLKTDGLMEVARNQTGDFHDFGIHEAGNVRYAAADATDFRKVAVSTPAGLKPMAYMRVMHTQPPVWKERKEEWPKEILGFWLFEDAVVGEKVELTQVGHEMIGFLTVNKLAVVVRDADAITPAGSMAIPVEMWKAMNKGEDPPATMDEAESARYNIEHSVPLDVTAMTSSLRN